MNLKSRHSWTICSRPSLLRLSSLGGLSPWSRHTGSTARASMYSSRSLGPTEVSVGGTQSVLQSVSRTDHPRFMESAPITGRCCATINNKAIRPWGSRPCTAHSDQVHWASRTTWAPSRLHASPRNVPRSKQPMGSSRFASGVFPTRHQDTKSGGSVCPRQAAAS